DGSHPWRGRGVRVPTLDELLAEHPGAPLNIEVKQDEPAIEAAVLAALDRHRARDRTLLAAEHAPIMSRIRAAAPDMLTSCSAAEVADFVLPWGRGRPGGGGARGSALKVPPSSGAFPIVPAESVAAAHRHGLEVHVWTIDDPAEMDALLDLGVDGIMTNLPALGVDVFRRRGLR